MSHTRYLESGVVIRGLALGTLNERTRSQFLLREVKMAVALSLILAVAGFFRAILFDRPPVAAAARAYLEQQVHSNENEMRHLAISYTHVSTRV